MRTFVNIPLDKVLCPSASMSLSVGSERRAFFCGLPRCRTQPFAGVSRRLGRRLAVWITLAMVRAAPSRLRRSSRLGRFRVCEIGSNGSMQPSQKKNSKRCERPSIAVAPLATKSGLTKSRNDTGYGTPCVRSDVLERSHHNKNEQTIADIPIVTFSVSRHLFCFKRLDATAIL